MELQSLMKKEQKEMTIYISCTLYPQTTRLNPLILVSTSLFVNESMMLCSSAP